MASLGIQDVQMLMNATDRNGRPYLTAIGSVADTGDVGVVGRGNRVNGLITPMSPDEHRGARRQEPARPHREDLHVMAMRLAREVHERFGGPSQVHIFTSKEAPLEAPDEVVVILPRRGRDRAEGAGGEDGRELRRPDGGTDRDGHHPVVTPDEVRALSAAAPDTRRRADSGRPQAPAPDGGSHVAVVVKPEVMAAPARQPTCRRRRWRHSAARE
ncbi:hypothetical protein GCM10023238_22310 [Streptomyces heliomycini]